MGKRFGDNNCSPSNAFLSQRIKLVYLAGTSSRIKSGYNDWHNLRYAYRHDGINYVHVDGDK